MLNIEFVSTNWQRNKLCSVFTVCSVLYYCNQGILSSTQIVTRMLQCCTILKLQRNSSYVITIIIITLDEVQNPEKMQGL